MPLYEYHCDACDHQFEIMQSMTVNPEDTTCPQCDATKSRRLMSAFASQIKGDHKPGFAEMKAYDMYHDRMDRFSKLPPIMGRRDKPTEANMAPPPPGSGTGES